LVRSGRSMPYELRLPDIGEGVAEGEIVRWLVDEGTKVKEDDLLVEILTDKAAMEMPSPVSGILAKIVAQPGQVVQVGEVLAIIEVASGESPGDSKPSSPGGDVLATPVVRKMARDLGVDLSTVSGTGPEGRVTEEDVRGAARLRREGFGGQAPGPTPAGPRADEERIPFRGKRRMAAKKMVLSKSTVPHALLVDEADATNLLAMREALREIGTKEGVRITILPFLVQVVVTALRAHPAMNASLDEARGEIVRKKRYDIGMAVDGEDGLVVPVIRDAGGKTIVELARDMMYISLSFDHRLIDGGTATRFMNDVLLQIESISLA